MRAIEEITIALQGGDGGAGCTSFRREKFIPKGGPDGGDGGNGGDVYLVASQKVINFSHLRKDKLYKAENGGYGSSNLKSGKRGENLIILIPIGSEIFLIENGKKVFYKDSLQEGEKYLILKGGRGGKGNTWFKKATNQTPRYSQSGKKSNIQHIFLNLKLIADVGLVGFPNAGKSTLLDAITNAHPKIGNYAFTTIKPNLGVLKTEMGEYITIADIPGILEGANKGYGLGISFLKHIERVKFIIYVIDIQSSSILEEEKILQNELRSYNDKMLEKPSIVVYNKIDLLPNKNALQKIIDSIPKEKKYFLISAKNQIKTIDLEETILSYFSS